LEIWDGRYAAFWIEGLEIENCTAVYEHVTLEDEGNTWPFAFISESREEVEAFVDKGVSEYHRSAGFPLP
jgi:hypothetical protein